MNTVLDLPTHTELQSIADLLGHLSQMQNEECVEERSNSARSVRKWHCGNGGKKTGREWAEKFRSHAERRRAIYKECLEENHCIVGANTDSNRYNRQLRPFMKTALAGDLIYLHCSHLREGSLVTHYGIYTGECKRIPTICGITDVSAHWAISVEQWIPLTRAIPGAGKNATIYQANSYPDPTL